jgi:hypothetical protein
MGFWLLYAGLLLATTGFVWCYDHPLAADMPMHVALAKVYADHLAGTDSAGSPYRPYLAVSSYLLPELGLVPLIRWFGIDLAWKIALSAYAFGFPLAVSFLVRRLNPAARWSLLAGFPITLNYFFHWGFWPFLAGLVLAVATTGVALGAADPFRPRIRDGLLRLLTFLCHPVPALCVGLFDGVRLGCELCGERGRGGLRAGAGLVLAWCPAALVALAMLGGEVDEGGFEWLNPLAQLTQLPRPFYLTRQWFEFALPLLFAGLLTWQLWNRPALCAGRGYVPVAGAVAVVLGVLMPRAAFIGSWENGARVILYGFILILASWSVLERRARGLILGWTLAGSAINLAGSHILWRAHEPAFAWAMAVLQREFSGYRVVEKGFWTGANGIALGNNLPVWAWCKGIVVDARNVAGLRKTGPAFYLGLPPERRRAVGGVILHYHPYRRPPELYGTGPERRVFWDAESIYSLEEWIGPEPVLSSEEEGANQRRPRAGSAARNRSASPFAP